jgi:hypothetical protein
MAGHLTDGSSPSNWSDAVRSGPLAPLVFVLIFCISACTSPEIGGGPPEPTPAPELTLVPELLFTISGETGLTAARDLTVDHAGNVYVFDYGDYVIRKFDSQGDVLAAFGGTGATPGQFNHLMAIRADGDSLIALDAGSMSVFELTGELRSRRVFSETIFCDHPRVFPDGRWIGSWISDERADLSLTYRREDGTEETRLASYLLGEIFPGIEPGVDFFINPTQARNYLYDFLPDGSVLWAASDEMRVFVYGDPGERDLGDEVFFEAPATPVPFPAVEIAALEERQAASNPPFFINVPTHYQLIHHLLVAESGEVWLYIQSQERTGLLRLSSTGEETAFISVEADFEVSEAHLALSNGQIYIMHPGREETAIYRLDIRSD